MDLRHEAHEITARIQDPDRHSRACRVLHETTFEYDRSMRTVAGWYRDGKVQLNPRATRAHQLETLAHELAHLFDHRLTQGTGHGPTWRAWCRALGIEPRECYDREERSELAATERRYRAVCRDCGNDVVRTYSPTRCDDLLCGSPDVHVTRADGFRAAAEKGRKGHEKA